MRDIEFPDVMVRAEFSGLAEQFFHLAVVLAVPVDLALRHQHRDIFLQLFIEILNVLFDGFVVVLEPSVLDLLGQFTQRIDMAIGQLFEFAIGFFWTGLRENKRVDVFEVVRSDALESEIHVFSQHISRYVEVLVLAVKQQNVRERLRRERRVS